MHKDSPSIPGYDYGEPSVARSPLSIEELRELEQTIGWSAADADILRRHADIFLHFAEEMVDSWRAVIASAAAPAAMVYWPGRHARR